MLGRIAVAAGSALLAGCSVLGIRSGYEQPAYEVVEELEGGVEVRRYGTRLAAETTVEAADREAILGGLDALEAEIEAGTFEWDPALEDIHMHVETRLRERIGEPAARLHTGRSRNDLVATDLALFLREHQDARKHLSRVGVTASLGTARRRVEQAVVALQEAQRLDSSQPGVIRAGTGQRATITGLVAHTLPPCASSPVCPVVVPLHG